MRKFLLSVIIIATSCLYSFGQIPGFKGRSGYFTMKETFKEGEDYVSKKVIFKLKKEYTSLIYSNNINHSDFQALLIAINGKVKRKHPAPFKSIHFNRVDNVENPLSQIFEIEYLDAFSLEQVINQLYSFNIIEYAEPLYIPKLLYVPNDPKAADQYYLSMVKAYSAWDIVKGDTNIVIGIVDTGVELTHPDLVNNIKRNYNDPIDGMDNDGDGYIDNFSGWDLGEGDNDPTPTAGGQHGTWVSGCAAAVPDNANGGAGVGFNSKFMPIKITNTSGYLTAAYDGIIYAAEHGCKVINTSWGTEGAYSQYGQEIINYVVNKGCVVVAAAGNSNNEGLFYPASFENVISVSGTDQVDEKWVFNSPNGSNYNSYVDLCAPAKAIYTSYQGGSFINIGGGTSFSSPQVAAAAAMVMAKFPTYSPKQVICQLKSTTDDIYGIAFNTQFKGKMGTGRLNVYRAVTETGFPYVQPVEIRANYGRLAKGETIDLWIDMVNYLSATNGVSATISTTNPNITIITNTSTYGAVGNMETKVASTPFKIVVGNGAALNEMVVFEVSVTDGSHTWKENASIRVNRDYIDITVNDLKSSVTNYGTVGFNFGQFGQGIKYKNTPLMYEMGLMIGIDSAKVSAARDYEFYTEPTMIVASPGESNFDVVGTFSDQSAGSKALNIQVTQKTLAWDTDDHSKYIIVEYCIKNKDTANINNSYIGLYADFDIIDGKKNIAAYVPGKKLGYAYKEGGLYAGVQLLTNETANFYAINNNGSNGSINIYDGFSSKEQFQALSSGISRTLAPEGDVAGMMSAGPINIPKGDSVWIAFAIIGGDDLNDITTSANNASSKYKELRSVRVTLTDYVDISCFAANDGKIGVDLYHGVEPYDVSWTNTNGLTSTTISNLASGNYTLKVKDKMKFEVSQNYTITEPAKLELSKGTISNVKCNGEKTGSAQLSVSGGSPNYYYNWHNSSIPSIATPNLPAGTHILTVSDSRNCTVNDTIIIKEPSKMQTFVIQVLDDSAGTSNGSASVSASGGTHPYTYSWNDSLNQHGASAFNLSENIYTVIISDSNNCSVSQEIIIAGKKASSNQNAVDEHDPAKYSMSIFPNPATNYFFIEFELPDNETIDLCLYDQNGKKCKQILNGNYAKGSYKTLVYTDDLSGGYYFYRLKTIVSSATGKVNILN